VDTSEEEAEFREFEPKSKSGAGAARQRNPHYAQPPENESESGTNGETLSGLFKPGHSIAWYAKHPIDHTQTLLGERYLCRGAGMFVVAPSGMGKSTFSLQAAILWCCGLIAFGIEPSKALRILIIQSEDDDGDCTEMASVMNHLGLTDEQKTLVEENSEVIRCNDFLGKKFVDAIRYRLDEARIAAKAFDLVIVNPYGSYLGADVKDYNACAKFLQELINPLLNEFGCGIILIHHTPKTNFQNTNKYSIWDWSYYGAGTAVITNWARSILVIKPETDDMSVFKFIAAKRGKRIGDEWEGGFEKYFAWSTKPGLLRWDDATAEQIAEATAAKSKKKSVDLDVALKQVPLVDAELKDVVIEKIQKACGVGFHRARTALNELIVASKAFNVPIPNEKGARCFAGVRKQP
jgi:RecA-family ATPase